MLCSPRSDILSGSRTSRFNANLVQRGVAYTANAVPSYPGDKHACVTLLYALPASGVSLPAVERALADQISALADTGPTQKELQRIKKVYPAPSSKNKPTSSFQEKSLKQPILSMETRGGQ